MRYALEEKSPAASPLELRDYQLKAVLGVRSEFVAGKRAVVLVSPTGSGKSVVASEIIRRAVEKGSTVLWIVHKRNLVHQMSGSLRRVGIEAGVIMAGVESATNEPVQVGTVQTFSRRLQLDDLERNRFFIKADLVIHDECHRAVSQQHKRILDLYKDKRILGLTATPCRADGRGLGEVFDSLVDVVDIPALTDQGFLAPVKYYIPSEPDLAKIRIVRGDYDVKELGKRANQPKLVGDVVDNWLRLAANQPTICFGVNVKHSLALRDEFRKRGVNAEHLDARSTDDERDFVFAEIERGRVQVVTNVGLFQEGLDIPCVCCAVIARPTKSMGLYRQMAGRALRPQIGKVATIIDHGGVVAEHGFLDEPIEWSLDGTKQAWNKPKREKAVKQPVVCSVCGYAFSGRSVCPECGSPVKTLAKAVEVVESDLVEAKRSNRKDTEIDKRRFFGMAQWQARDKGYKDGWASWQYRNRYGVWPNKYRNVSPIQPDEGFKNWLKHLAIKRAKGKK